MNDQALLVRRYVECTAFVLLWMACEHFFRLSPLVGQLTGIPLIAVFQVVVARRPIAQLWARDARRFRADRWTWAVAAGLALGCGVLLWLGRDRVAAGLGSRGGLFFLLAAAAVPAAVPAAFALRQQRGGALRRALPWLGVVVVFRVVWFAAWNDGAVGVPADKLLDFFTLWACEAVALFLVDEVAFRGAVDPHLEGAGAGRLHAWCSAIYGSILWSVWHLPAYNPGAKSFGAMLGGVTVFNLAIVGLGVLFCFAARRGRTLVGTAVVHALGNAFILAHGP